MSAMKRLVTDLTIDLETLDNLLDRYDAEYDPSEAHAALIKRICNMWSVKITCWRRLTKTLNPAMYWERMKGTTTMDTKAHKPFFADFGSVSSGTMRERDLVPAFIEALDELKEAESLSSTPNKERYTRIDDMLAEIEQRIAASPITDDSDGYYSSEACSFDLNESLFDALDEYAPPLGYFGANEGDGADFGFWLSLDALQDAEDCGELVKVAAGDHWPPELAAETDYVLEVTDHGNATLFDARTRVELWAIV